MNSPISGLQLPQRIVLLDIDGLRHDVFQKALAAGALPNLSRLTGGSQFANGLQYEAVCPVPSITYCCQASTITGAHPRDHLIPGNMFLDRFGRMNGGQPRQYFFDGFDAPLVFLKGLAGSMLSPEIETLYETAARRGLASTVAYNMYALGAQHWLRPGPDDWRIFASVTRPDFGEIYDDHMLQDVLQHFAEGHRPDVLLLYFFGLDHESHMHGPHIQYDYLTRVIDRQVGDFIQKYEGLGLLPNTLFSIFSDHGQIEVQNDDLHALKVGFLFDREYGLVFEALGLDVYDHPLEGLNCDAMLCPNGGMAHVYLRKTGGDWHEAPEFTKVQRVAQEFWNCNVNGDHCLELKDALELILVRNVEKDGWFAEYQVFTPQGLMSLTEYDLMHPEAERLDAANRLHHLTSPLTGDILLFAHYLHGYSFSVLPYKGIHGGLHPQDSTSVMGFCLPGAAPEQVKLLRERVSAAISARCQAEGGRAVSNVDLAYALRMFMQW